MLILNRFRFWSFSGPGPALFWPRLSHYLGLVDDHMSQRQQCHVLICTETLNVVLSCIGWGKCFFKCSIRGRRRKKKRENRVESVHCYWLHWTMCSNSTDQTRSYHYTHTHTHTLTHTHGYSPLHTLTRTQSDIHIMNSWHTHTKKL